MQRIRTNKTRLSESHAASQPASQTSKSPSSFERKRGKGEEEVAGIYSALVAVRTHSEALTSHEYDGYEYKGLIAGFSFFLSLSGQTCGSKLNNNNNITN